MPRRVVAVAAPGFWVLFVAWAEEEAAGPDRSPVAAEGELVLGGAPATGGLQDALFYLLVLGLDKIPLWGIVLISAGSAVLCALVVWFFVCPRMKRKIDRK